VQLPNCLLGRVRPAEGRQQVDELPQHWLGLAVLNHLLEHLVDRRTAVRSEAVVDEWQRCEAELVVVGVLVDSPEHRNGVHLVAERDASEEVERGHCHLGAAPREDVFKLEVPCREHVAVCCLQLPGGLEGHLGRAAGHFGGRTD
jgi:hypothetical protein